MAFISPAANRIHPLSIFGIRKLSERVPKERPRFFREDGIMNALTYEVSPMGENLKYIRESRGMSQQELADRINVTRFVIIRYESGEQFIPGNIALDLARELGVTPNDILIHPHYMEKVFVENNICPEIHDMFSSMEDIALKYAIIDLFKALMILIYRAEEE